MNINTLSTEAMEKGLGLGVRGVHGPSVVSLLSRERCGTPGITGSVELADVVLFTSATVDWGGYSGPTFPTRRACAVRSFSCEFLRGLMVVDTRSDRLLRRAVGLAVSGGTGRGAAMGSRAKGTWHTST